MSRLTGGRMARRPGETWEAKFPDHAAEDGRRVGSILPPEIWGHLNTLRWYPSPPTSHLLSFAYKDARPLLLVRHPDSQEYVYKSPSDLPLSSILIRFKAKGRAPITQYRYSSRNHALLERIWELLKAADQPGKVLHAELEQNPEVDYTQMAVQD